MKISYVTSAFTTNSYYVESANESIIVDCSDTRVMDLIQQPVKAILLTHAHVDHIEKLEEIRTELSKDVYLQETGQEILANPDMNGSAMFGQSLNCQPADQTFKGKEFVFSFGDVILKTLHTPGHSPDSSIFYSEEEKVVFCGDLIFENSIGRSDFPHSDTKTHLENVRKVLDLFTDNWMCYPGHGAPFLLGAARKEIEMVVNLVEGQGL